MEQYGVAEWRTEFIDLGCGCWSAEVGQEQNKEARMVGWDG